MNFYKEFMVTSVSIIVKKREKPFYNRSFKKRTLGSGFVYFLEGNGIYTDKNGRKIPFSENDFLLVEYGKPYTIEASDCEIEYITTAFSLDDKSSFDNFGLPTFYSAKEDDFLRLKVLSLLGVWEKNSVYSKMESRLILNEIFLQIQKNTGKKAPFGEYSPVTPAIIYINKHYSDNMAIEELAKMCLMSESYFRSQFRKYMGTSPLKYREKVRIDWAKKYLKTNLFSVTEIAEKLGYCDIYHFSKVFKQYVGVTPANYRKKAL